MAFREGRILNSKQRYVPKIRAYYQKLEGLRDDLYLQIELKQGDANSRIMVPARPAQWYDGFDSKMDGEIAFADDEEGFGCGPYASKLEGKVVFVKRGRCLFSEKMQYAKEAGAKSVVVYDVKISKQPLERQGMTGATRSKGIATRSAGDALSGGVALTPKEQGVTIMTQSPGDAKPFLDGVMINLDNATAISDAFKVGTTPRILDVKRFDFTSNIDEFIKKDLKKMLNEMDIYGSSMRTCKECMSDPILNVLKSDRMAFADAVKSKDYTAIRRTFLAWNNDLDAEIGRWDLAETY